LSPRFIGSEGSSPSTVILRRDDRELRLDSLFSPDELFTRLVGSSERLSPDDERPLPEDERLPDDDDPLDASDELLLDRRRRSSPPSERLELSERPEREEDRPEDSPFDRFELPLPLLDERLGAIRVVSQ